MDLLYLALAAGFFALTAVLVSLVERLRGP
jgi:hypothetical protein